MATQATRTGYTVRVYRFGGLPELEFKSGGLLASWEQASPEAYASGVGQALYQALRAAPEDEEFQLVELPGERLALVGLTIAGRTFAVAERRR